MSGFLRCVLYLLVLALLAHPLGQALPRRWFDGERFPYRCYKWEKQGKLYTRIGVDRWKTLVPDMSRILPDMVKKQVTPTAVTAAQAAAHRLQPAGPGVPGAVARLGRRSGLAGVVPAGQPALYPHSTLQQTAAHPAAGLAATTGAAERKP